MSDHMAPQRLELSRRDERGQTPSSPRRPASPRAYHDVPDYGVVEYPPPAYPGQLDDDYAPQSRRQDVHPATYRSGEMPPSPTRLDRSGFRLPPYETRPAAEPAASVPTHWPRPATLPEPAESVETTWDDSDAPLAEPVVGHEPAPSRYDFPSVASGERNVSPEDAGMGESLPVSHYRELRDQLMHTIHLYNDEWRLGGIRTSENKLVAYLTPRNKKVNLKDAIHRRQVLVITVDSRGNTDVKEPRPRSWLRRLIDRLTGES